MKRFRLGGTVATCACALLCAIPSVAAADGDGNAAAAHKCQQGGYASLFAQGGSTFANSGQCTSYAAHGGDFAGMGMAPGPVTDGTFAISFSGFGLEPGSTDYGCVRYLPSGIGVCAWGPADSTGTFSATDAGFPCTWAGDPAAYLYSQARTAAGVTVREEFPLPSGCS